MTDTLTRKQAEQALAAVRRQFSAYIEPGVSEPALVESWTDDGHWAIVWEDGGPYEWAYRATMGGVDEEIASLGAEFGYVPPVESPVTWPEGVYAEPYFSFVLALYPA